jgi:hypothetical protein
LAEFAVLGVVVVSAGFTLRRSRANPSEKWAWLLAVLLAVLLSRTLWDSHADFRGFEDLYVLSTLIVLDSDRRAGLVAVLVGAIWVVTFVHRALYF